MSTPKKIYLLISDRAKIELLAIKPPVLLVNQVLYKVDEDLYLYDIMDWMAEGMKENPDIKRIG
jgi:hypothetical protein